MARASSGRAVIGILALEVALGGVLMMRWIGLYGLDVLLDPGRAVLGALVVSFGLGGLAFVCTHFGLFALQGWWIAGWAGVC